MNFIMLCSSCFNLISVHHDDYFCRTAFPQAKEHILAKCINALMCLSQGKEISNVPVHDFKSLKSAWSPRLIALHLRDFANTLLVSDELKDVLEDDLKNPNPGELHVPAWKSKQEALIQKWEDMVKIKVNERRRRRLARRLRKH
jgi:hypothetical protein